MKVLHIWNTAGIGSILCKYLKRVGIIADCMERKQYDKFGFKDYYKDTTSLNYPSSMFMLICLQLAKNYNIIHVHSLLEIIPKLRNKYPDKIIIFHAHGSEIRNNPKAYNDIDSLVNVNIVSTTDLLFYGNTSVYLPNPVDTELFKPNNAYDKYQWLAMYDSKSFLTDIPSHIDANIVDRNKVNWEYKDMPDILNSYIGYIDIKIVNGQRLKALSTVGLQALACGLDVINYENKRINGLPLEHQPQYVIEKLIQLYNGLFDKTLDWVCAEEL